MEREALKLALEALETCYEDEWHSEDDFGLAQTYDENKVAPAIAAIKAALAQPAQELVKYKCTVIDDQHPQGIPLEQWGNTGKAQPAQEPDVVMHCDSHTWTINNPPPKGSGDVNLYYAARQTQGEEP
jgi:hypothetical protein